MNDATTSECSGPSISGAIILTLNVLALLFSALMLMWAMSELSHEGERWGLVGVLVFGGLGLGVEVVLLLLTFLLVVKSKTLTRGFQLITLGVIIPAILLDAAALACAFSEPSRHKQAFIQRSAMHQSGIRQAVLDGDVKRAQAILEADSRLVEETGYQGESILLLATKAGDRPMVEMLLAHGAKPGASDLYRTTPLHLAAKQGNVGIATLLLDKGALVNAEDMDGKTPLAYAQAAGHKAMVDLILARGGADRDYEALLIKAVEDGNIQQAATLLEKGMSVNTSVPNGHCLLDFAAEKGSVAMAKLLISRGASVKRADRYGRTALHWASGEGNADMIRFLVDQGAEVNARDYEGMTPLHFAIESSYWHEDKSLEAIKGLVESGADVNARNGDGKTPLAYAEKWGTDSIRAYLRDSGGTAGTQK